MEYKILNDMVVTEVSHQWHVEVEGKFYLISYSFRGHEVFVFPTNAKGEWIDSSEILGMTHTSSHREGLEALIEYLEDQDSMEDEDEEESNTLSECEALERFDDFLNEVYPSVSICGYDYDAARAFKEVDPIAYREEFNNWLDSEGLELE